jgi:DNA-directed RNA polymerase subunit RPC12/RpoP
MKNKKKTTRTYTKIAGKIKKVDFQPTKEPAKALPDAPPPDFHPGEDPIIKFKLDAERDAEIQKKKDLEAGAAIYVSWKNKLINRRHTIGEILESLSDLTSQLDEKIQSKWKNYVINELINPVIAHFHNMKIVADFSQAVVIDCPKCEWGGKGLFHRHIWDSGTAEMTCPECGHRCTQKDVDMITEEQGRQIAAQASGGKK